MCLKDVTERSRRLSIGRSRWIAHRNRIKVFVESPGHSTVALCVEQRNPRIGIKAKKKELLSWLKLLVFNYQGPVFRAMLMRLTKIVLYELWPTWSLIQEQGRKATVPDRSKFRGAQKFKTGKMRLFQSSQKSHVDEQSIKVNSTRWHGSLFTSCQVRAKGQWIMVVGSH